MTPLVLVCVTVLFGGAIADIIPHTACEELSQNECTVHQVGIDRCSSSETCKLKKGYPASISFDFTPPAIRTSRILKQTLRTQRESRRKMQKDFSASKLKTRLYWVSSSQELPFALLHLDNGCELTSCPLKSGRMQELTYDLRFSKKYPARAYDLRWKLWNEDDENQLCCFQFKVKLVK